jgi:hypothetical protein
MNKLTAAAIATALLLTGIDGYAVGNGETAEPDLTAIIALLESQQDEITDLRAVN